MTLVWESNPKLQGGWCKPNHQPSGDLEPTQGEAGVSRVFIFKVTGLCVFITEVPIRKLLAWGEGDSGGNVLRETTVTNDEPRPVWTRLPITQ